MIKKIKNYFLYKFLLSHIKPEIIGGFKNPGGNYCAKTGISNFTHISNKGKNLEVGENVFIGHFNYIDAHNARVTISRNVQITNYVSIITHSSHLSIRLFEREPSVSNLSSDISKTGEVFIGEFSYIGPHVVIMPGTKIGKGCIVSAYSYVNGEFPDFSIIRGQPAKTIGDTRDIDKKVLENYPQFREFYSDNIYKFK